MPRDTGIVSMAPAPHDAAVFRDRNAYGAWQPSLVAKPSFPLSRAQVEAFLPRAERGPAKRGQLPWPRPGVALPKKNIALLAIASDQVFFCADFGADYTAMPRLGIHPVRAKTGPLKKLAVAAYTRPKHVKALSGGLVLSANIDDVAATHLAKWFMQHCAAETPIHEILQNARDMFGVPEGPAADVHAVAGGGFLGDLLSNTSSLLNRATTHLGKLARENPELVKKGIDYLSGLNAGGAASAPQSLAELVAHSSAAAAGGATAGGATAGGATAGGRMVGGRLLGGMLLGGATAGGSVAGGGLIDIAKDIAKDLLPRVLPDVGKALSDYAVRRLQGGAVPQQIMREVTDHVAGGGILSGFLSNFGL